MSIDSHSERANIGTFVVLDVDEIVFTVLPDKKHDQAFGIKVRKVLPDEKHDQTFGIKVREVLPDEKHNQTLGIKIKEMLPDEKHNQTFESKVREVLPDEKYDQTFEIKVRKVLPDEKHDVTFRIRKQVIFTKNVTTKPFSGSRRRVISVSARKVHDMHSRELERGTNEPEQTVALLKLVGYATKRSLYLDRRSRQTTKNHFPRTSKILGQKQDEPIIGEDSNAQMDIEISIPDANQSTSNMMPITNESTEDSSFKLVLSKSQKKKQRKKEKAEREATKAAKSSHSFLDPSAKAFTPPVRLGLLEDKTIMQLPEKKAKSQDKLNTRKVVENEASTVITEYQPANNSQAFVQDIIVYDIPAKWDNYMTINALFAWGKVIFMTVKWQKKYKT
ncbi:hypothetical protein RclHR1_04210003 [Rhizophagus clarus]|uniref:Uncharacterized protein n=1 Tax=Rhizophagus clarus TaxID=94130 RepID=A0A2Z6SA34_9GLOM|nr:hypothetical protein RclHR1_04210003 [Rhizophagus clarus]